MAAPVVPRYAEERAGVKLGLISTKLFGRLGNQPVYAADRAAHARSGMEHIARGAKHPVAILLKVKAGVERFSLTALAEPQGQQLSVAHIQAQAVAALCRHTGNPANGNATLQRLLNYPDGHG